MMQSFAVVRERAETAGSNGPYPAAKDFVEGFFLGHRAAEVDNRKECPEGKNVVAYNLGYDYAARLDVRFADPSPKKKPPARKLLH